MIAHEPMLSVCMIVKNEGRFLEDCLESVRTVAAEIIIVDTGSTDNTLQIALRHDAKILTAPWEEDFAKARNIALAQATMPWILSIDADERLLNPELMELMLRQATDRTGGILIDVISEARRPDGGVDRFTSQLLRLFRNNPRIRFEGAIHEQIADSILRLGMEISASDIQFSHLGYDLSPDMMQLKQRRNLNMLNFVLKKNYADAYAYFQRAKTHLALGNIAEAEKDTQMALRFANRDGAVRPQALNYGGIIAFQLREFPLAIQRAEESLSLVPNQQFAYFILGEVYSEQQDWKRAVDAYLGLQRSQEIGDVIARVVGQYELPQDQLAFKIGRCYVGLQNWGEAERYFRAGLVINPKDTACRIGLANVAARLSRFPEAKELLREAMRLEPKRRDILQFIAQVDQIEKSFHIRKPGTTQNVLSFTGDEDTQEGAAPRKPLLTLSMIVKNEEHTLAECLKSVEGVADEIVIVDTGSTDRTIDIARQFGAKVYHFPWRNDFAAARNEALKYCTGEWILYLDADERILPEQKEYIRDILSRLPDVVGAIVCTIVSPHRMTDDSTQMHQGPYPRIFRNYGYPTIRFQGRVHEQISPSIIALGKDIPMSDVIIKHTGYDADRNVMEQKVQRNYQLLLKHVQEEPDNAYAWFQLGQTLGRMNLPEQAAESLKMSLKLGKLADYIQASAAGMLAHMAGGQKNYTEALKWAEFSLQKSPDQVQAVIFKAYALMYLGRYAESEAAFLEAQDRMNRQVHLQQGKFEVAMPEESISGGLQMLYDMMGKRPV